MSVPLAPGGPCSRAFSFVLMLVLSASSARAQLFDDGQVHTIDGQYGASSAIYISPGYMGSVTTVNVVNGAEIYGYDGSAIASDGGIINISGGLLHDGIVDRCGLLSISGGIIQGRVSAGGYYNGTTLMPVSVSISGGTMGTLIVQYPDSLSISGGTISGDWGAFIALHGAEHGFISGGSFTGTTNPALYVVAGGSSTMDITGGRFNGVISILADDAASVNFVGHDFSFSGGILDGVLADGTPIHSQVISHPNDPFAAVGGGDSIRFVNPAAVPAPSSLFLALAGLASLVVRYISTC